MQATVRRCGAMLNGEYGIHISGIRGAAFLLPTNPIPPAFTPPSTSHIDGSTWPETKTSRTCEHFEDARDFVDGDDAIHGRCRGIGADR